MQKEGNPRAQIDIQDLALKVSNTLKGREKYVPPLEAVTKIVAEISSGARVTIFIPNLAEKVIADRYPHSNIQMTEIT